MHFKIVQQNLAASDHYRKFIFSTLPRKTVQFIIRLRCQLADCNVCAQMQCVRSVVNSFADLYSLTVCLCSFHVVR